MKRIFLIALVAGLVYFPIIFGFFAQDEWYGFGNYINSGFQVVSNGLIPGQTHYVPLAHIFNFLSFFNFGLNYQYYAVSSIVLHMISSVIVYLFIKELTEDDGVSLMTGLLFAISASSYQATSWVFADTASHGALIMSVFGSWLFLRFLKNENWMIGLLSVVSLLISLLFKEITIGVFIWLGYITWFRSGNKKFVIKASLLMILMTVLYVLIRFLGVYFHVAKELPSTYMRSYSEAAYTAVTLPIKAIAQSLIPASQIFRVSYGIADQLKGMVSVKYGTSAFDRLVENNLFDPINVFFFILIVQSLVIFWIKDKKMMISLGIPALGWTIINSFIYVMAPGKLGVIHEIEPRNLYLPALGIMLYISIFLKSMFKIDRKFVLFFGVYFVFLLFSLENSLSKIVKEGRVREDILQQIKSEHPVLTNKTIFYTESDKSFYGLPHNEKILPFQSGLGQTLMVWYQVSHQLPKEFFMNDYLWDIGAQDYKEVNGVGFGYYRDFEKMQRTVLQYNLPIDSIIGYRYDSKLNQLMDTTIEMQNRLRLNYE